LATAALFAQEEMSDMDALFEAPPEDVAKAPTEEEVEIDHTAAFNVADKTSLSGSFSATGGVGLGWIDLPDILRPMDGLDASYIAKSALSAIFDARPDQDLRIHGGFSVSLDPTTGNYSWSTIAVDELFCDYTLLDKAFIRFGKHTIAWGQGRLYTPGNLMAGSENGTAFKLSFPTVLSGLSFVALAQDSYFTNTSSPSIKEFAYGALADIVISGLRTSFGLRYREPEGYQALGSFKIIVKGTDLLCDIVGRYGAEGEMSGTTLTGFYREWKDFSIYGEWLYTVTTSTTSQAFGAAAAYNNIGGSSIDIGAKWLHSFDPNSGAIALGVSWDPFKFVEVSVALPYVYGTPGRYDIIDEDMPLTQRVSLVLLVKISASF
jgi:hypothetical protein